MFQYILIFLSIALLLAAIYLLTSLGTKEKANKEKLRKVLKKMSELGENEPKK